jgi:hypothetical protein
VRATSIVAFVLATVVGSAVAGCSVPGPRDDDAARRVARTAEGIPAYEGQALLVRSCAGCHGEELTGDQRHGAPFGLDFDVSIASTSSRVGELTRLDRAQRLVYAQRAEIWRQIDIGAMPPGDAGRQAEMEGEQYFHPDRAPLPGLDTPEGREIVRNWLRSDAPVIERTEPRADDPPYSLVVGDTVPAACASSADCPYAVSSRCDPVQTICVGCIEDGDCAHLDDGTTACDMARGTCVVPVEPRFASIHAEVIAARCATSLCHGARQAGRLDMRTIAGAHAALVNVMADGSTSCRDAGGTRVVPGDPEGSLLFQKLGGVPGLTVCGGEMPLERDPLPAQHVEAIGQWIAAGAAND